MEDNKHGFLLSVWLAKLLGEPTNCDIMTDNTLVGTFQEDQMTYVFTGQNTMKSLLQDFSSIHIVIIKFVSHTNRLLKKMLLIQVYPKNLRVK